MKRKHNVKRGTRRLAAALGALMAAVCLVPFAGRKENVRSSAETYAVDGIGFSVNVFKHEYGEFDSQFSILDGDYIVSGEMPVTKFDGFGGTFNGGKSYKTYAALAKDVSSDYHFSHADLNGAYAFLAEADKAFGGVLSIGQEREPWDSAFYFWKERMVSFYTLRLDNSNGFFIDYYKDHLNPYFLFALEQIRTGEIGYEEFFDSYGTHLVTEVTYGLRTVGYYGAFCQGGYLDETARQQLHESAESAYDAYAEGKEGFWNLPENVVEKYNLSTVGSFRKLGETSAEENGETRIRYEDLLPLYNALPETYADLAEPMKAAFAEYAAAHTKLYENSVKKERVEIRVPQSKNVPYAGIAIQKMLVTIAGGVTFSIYAVCAVVLVAASVLRRCRSRREKTDTRPPRSK